MVLKERKNLVRRVLFKVLIMLEIVVRRMVWCGVRILVEMIVVIELVVLWKLLMYLNINVVKRMSRRSVMVGVIGLGVF